MNATQTATGSTVASVAMATLAFTSLLANVCVSLVIIWTPQLRAQFNHVLTLSLFVLDTLISLFVMPLDISSYIQGHWPIGDTFCQIHGVLSSSLMTASMLTLCAISMERCYSIHAPMHYAAHMTLPRTIAVIICIWIQALLVSLMPLFGWNSYAYRSHRAQCSISWDEHRSYVVLFSVFSFVLPGVTMVAMYSAIFRIARQSAQQIAPEVSMATIPAISIHWKAARTLLSLISVFLVSWLPYFVVALLGVRQEPRVQLAVTWLGLSSLALNPMLYGYLNRSIREAAISCCEELKNMCLRRTVDDEAAAPTENEDFFQFLERTSVTRAVSIRCSQSQIFAHSPTITE
ncbi:hypothetical protein CAPTEDRAFT_131359 [Capitella teleta]|uniref:G-protein coupled receptors family 1 profile domain-containing protein n=1 Tax=Capitella teleta TaxID=283909 RepID=R7TCF0_CAPTE|nr:hypothetical protein CAPTEDRAFT_131359 [Capitella teleta]|eukprot:ELT88736.1 hypothetical protein CAPTEDRAFT_131359 [Capitella teleta]